MKFMPRRDNSKVFQFKRETSIVEFKNSEVLANMPKGLQYLVAKELTRVDIAGSENLDYDYVRIVKQGKEVCLDVIFTSAIELEEAEISNTYDYYLVEVVSVEDTKLRDGNYNRKERVREYPIGLLQMRYNERSLGANL